MKVEKGRKRKTYMLTKARFDFLSLVAMTESRRFCVEAMQTIGLFVNKCIVLGNKLPSDFRRNDVLVDGG